MRRWIFITHPNVVIDAAVSVPRWPLSERAWPTRSSRSPNNRCADGSALSMRSGASPWRPIDALP
jgi:hypothetical protein